LNIFVIGCNGQLGQDMMIALHKTTHSAQGLDFPNIDITKSDSVQDAFNIYKPDIVINCAAHALVDACETEAEKAYAINSTGVKNIALAAKITGAKVVHISTDYVFDGKKTTPYIETDATNPQSVYGKSKLAGEQELAANYERYFTFRIAWLYGTRGNNFLKTIRSIAEKRAASNEPLKVVNDQFGTPTYTVHVCQQILKVMETEHFGIYHSTSEGQCSWFDFASAIIKAYTIPVTVLPCTTKEFPRPAPRPAYSVLENQTLKQLGLNIMPQWEAGLREYMEEESKK
jgi:dTDP-4-dehydrorhamnose reductase